MIGSLATCSTNNSLPCRRAMSKAVLSAFSEEGAKLTGTRMRFLSHIQQNFAPVSRNLSGCPSHLLNGVARNVPADQLRRIGTKTNGRQGQRSDRMISPPRTLSLEEVERLFDGVWVAIGIGLAAIFAPLPEDLIEAGEAFGAIIALIVALFIYLVLHRPGRRRSGRPANRGLLGWKPLRAAAALLTRLGEGLRETGRTKEFYLAFVLSLLFLALQTLAFWLIMLGYGLRLSLWVGVTVMLIVHLGTAIPNAPANVGSYQFFTVLGLTLFGVDKTSATGFSLVVFTLLTLPLLVIGFLALSRSGMSLATIRVELRRPERRADQQSNGFFMTS